MKKAVSFIMVFVMLLSLPLATYATEATENDFVEVRIEDKLYESDIMPAAVLGLSFSNLQPDHSVLSTETYYVSDDSSMINITTATWNPASCNLAVGWYNTRTAVCYFVYYSGGSIGPRSITSEGLPAGDYKICVRNKGDQNITGSVQYYVV